MTLEEFNLLDENTVGKALEATYGWATQKWGFDTTFLESLMESYEKWGKLTERQKASVYNICIKFDNGVLDEFEAQAHALKSRSDNLRV